MTENANAMSNPSGASSTDDAANGKAAEGLLLTPHIVRVVGVRKTYTTGGIDLHALESIDFSVRRGEYMSIVGPSGSGKTTLFNMIGGLDKPNEGRVYIDEVDIATLSAVELAGLRCHKIGYIFQTFNLIPAAAALDNVILPMLFAGAPRSDAREKAAELLAKVGLGEYILHKPVQMSGGQQQRVAIARALANDPAILLADEPTGNLDLGTGEEIVTMLKHLKDDLGVTIVAATHDRKMLAASDRVVHLVDGAITRIDDRGDLDISFGAIDGEDT